MRQVAEGLWHWTARHPEWHPGVFGAEVGSYALRAGDELLLVDPLVPDDARQAVDDLAAGARAVHVLITIGYHARSAEALARRYGCRIQGPPRVASRLEDRSLLEVLEPGVDGPAGVRAFAIGRPVRGERPLWLPSHRAIAFGDAVVTTPDGALRVWAQERLDERRARWYRERFNPTLEPLAALEPRRVLTTHGAPVLAGGAAALRGALASEPWYSRG
jgi:glyoxylase-like metal-dependent hydrolase (beta-lactamase superfamily II)